MEHTGYVGFIVFAFALALLQYNLYRRDKRLDRKDREKKEAYAGLLEAISALQEDADLPEADVKLRYWVARVQLVCSEEVLNILLNMKGAKRKSVTAKVTIDALIFAMRRDLGIAD